ncbi:HNH endonuclease [Chryseobacterium sp.]|uniref:HNH endonuclease n=1 Tax=Chryseobacterium sp. TaxID=1871047 RepID=UPI0023F10482|nr:HNH endonuclease [Chryseobacterium sp.]
MRSQKKKIDLENYIVEDRPSIKEIDKLKLYTKSGGRCAICNKYLIDLGYGVNIGEMAHIVGWTNKQKSPRGISALPIDKRNTEENLILLCAEHHKIIDDKKALEEFTVERLIAHKNEHESRIHHLTNLHKDSDSVVLRMLGNIRGISVELSQENARHAVYNTDKKFARFIDSFDKQSIEIDLSALPEPEINWDSYWQMGTGIIDKELRLFEQGINSGSIRHLSVFALTRIPLLIYLGYKIGDKVPVSVYQKQRANEERWAWQGNEDIQFEIETKQIKASDDVILILSLSGSIDLDKLPADLISSASIYLIKPVNTVPNRDIFLSKKTYENFVKMYHQFLSSLEIEQKSCKNLHLFPAIPISAGIACGRGLMRNIHPALIVYDFAEKEYLPTIKINAYETN